MLKATALGPFVSQALWLAASCLLLGSNLGIGATIHVSAVNGVGAMDQVTNGNCSLPEAVEAAIDNQPVDACESGEPAGIATDVIVLPANSVFSATAPAPLTERMLPFIGDGLVMEGNGSTLERAASAQIQFGLLQAVNGDLTLRNLTLANGDATTAGSFTDGGAVLNAGAGALVIENVRFFNNRAVRGGAVYSNPVARPVIQDSVFRGNSAEYGGAFAQARLGPTTLLQVSAPLILNSVFEDNQAAIHGGALWIERNGLRIGASTFKSNRVQLGFGGAIYLDFQWSLQLANSTIYENHATSSSYGGIYAQFGDIDIRNSTIARNTGLEPDRGFQVGMFQRGSLRIDNSTILNASYPLGTFPWAIQLAGFPQDVSFPTKIYSSVIGGCDFDPPNREGDVFQTNWFIYDNCDGTADGDPRLGPLQDNGGATLTYAPLEGSPLIDAAVLADFKFDVGGDGLGLDEFRGSIDQRGLPRPEEGFDIGSVEVQPPTGFNALSPGERAGVILLLQQSNQEPREEAP